MAFVRLGKPLYFRYDGVPGAGVCGILQDGFPSGRKRCCKSPEPPHLPPCSARMEVQQLSDSQVSFALGEGDDCELGVCPGRNSCCPPGHRAGRAPHAGTQPSPRAGAAPRLPSAQPWEGTARPSRHQPQDPHPGLQGLVLSLLLCSPGQELFC